MQFAYGLKYRPASVGAVPQGRFTVKDALSGEGARCTRHGVIVYDRPLTESEIRSFELVVLADDQQMRIPIVRDRSVQFDVITSSDSY